MKSFSKVLCILFISSFLSVAALAQKVETEGELFSKIYRLTQTKKTDDRDQAYRLSKIFMSKFGKNTDGEVKKVRDFMETYETAFVTQKIEEGKTAEAFAFGKEAFALAPENTYLAMTLAYAGYQAYETKKDAAFSADSVQYAQKAIQLIGENKLPKSFQPFADQSEATAWMYYVIGKFKFESNLKESAQNYYKALQFTSKVKNSSLPYSFIAFYYEKEVEKTLKEFEAKYGANMPPDAEAKLDKLLTGAQDAYARAIKLGETDNAVKAVEWKKRYEQIYSFVKGSDAGSAEFLANVLMTPMPDPSAQ